jgi:SMC interacting uncharacterized protein involved in chromosome segregation
MDPEILNLRDQMATLKAEVANLEKNQSRPNINCDRHYTELAQFRNQLTIFGNRLALKVGNGELVVLKNDVTDTINQKHEDLKDFITLMIQTISNKAVTLPQEPARNTDPNNAKVQVAKVKASADIVGKIVTGFFGFLGGGAVLLLVQKLLEYIKP